MEFHLSYNPFTVQTELYARIEEKWIPVSENSGLFRFSKMRMQRWLEMRQGKSFFDELFQAAGESDITLIFSGTKEDFEDLKKAAALYKKDHAEYTVSIAAGADENRNSSAVKLYQLKQLLEQAKKSSYCCLLPAGIWEILSNRFRNTENTAELVQIEEWPSRKGRIFDRFSWSMICFVLSYECLKSKETRAFFKEFSSALSNAGDRYFERERFFLICKYDSVKASMHVDVRKALMEYGIQDLDLSFLSEEECGVLDEEDYPGQSKEFYYTQKRIIIYKERYAEQYMLRRIHDCICSIFQEEGYFVSHELMKKVDTALRGSEINGDHISDEMVTDAAAWVTAFLHVIQHLLDIDMSL